MNLNPSAPNFARAKYARFGIHSRSPIASQINSEKRFAAARPARNRPGLSSRLNEISMSFRKAIPGDRAGGIPFASRRFSIQQFFFFLSPLVTIRTAHRLRSNFKHLDAKSPALIRIRFDPSTTTVARSLIGRVLGMGASPRVDGPNRPAARESRRVRSRRN